MKYCYFFRELTILLQQYVTLCKAGSSISCGSAESRHIAVTIDQDRRPADTYGAEHLLRMLCKIIHWESFSN